MLRMFIAVSFLAAATYLSGPAAAQEGGLRFRLPDDVRRSLTIPRVKGDHPRPPTGRVVEVALVLRDGVSRVVVNGAPRDWPGTKTELARLADTSRDTRRS